MELNEQRVSELAAKLGTTKEEVQSYLVGKEGDEVKTITQVLPNLLVKDSDVFKNIISHQVQAEVTTRQSTLYGETLGKIDKDLATEFGVEKPAEVKKTADFIRHIIQSKSGQTASEREKQLEKEALDYKTKWEQAKGEVETVKTEYTKKEQKILVTNDQQSAAKQFPIDADERFLGTFQNVLIEELNKRYTAKTDENGQIIYYPKGSQVPAVDHTKGNAPKTAHQLMQEFAQEVVPIKKQSSGKQGAGIKDTPLKTGDGKGTINFTAYQSRQEFNDHLVASGIGLMSSEGIALVQEFKKARPDLFK